MGFLWINRISFNSLFYRCLFEIIEATDFYFTLTTALTTSTGTINPNNEIEKKININCMTFASLFKNNLGSDSECEQKKDKLFSKYCQNMVCFVNIKCVQ